jgi:predicted phage terminase large subunit-like protein
MAETTEPRRIAPQPGPQEAFLSTPADIAIMGGAAGGGKTWALLLEPLRHAHNGQFGAVIFRRTSPQITAEGGMWDEAGDLYPEFGAVSRQSPHMYFGFPSGAKVQFAHLQHETDKESWKGAQIPLICFDQLEDFTEGQFFYLLSRNRSTCGVRPYVRGTCNPDADSWLATFLAWWIDQETGYPIPERSGVIRWMVRISDTIVWGNDPKTLAAEFPETIPKSVTFIPAKLEDNPALEEADPGYRANLMALPLVERERLLGGNWKIRPKAGLYFRRGWFDVVNVAPAGCQWVRAWDLAATTKKTKKDDPDWTAAVKLGRDPITGQLYVGHVERSRSSPRKVKKSMRAMAEQDGVSCRIRIPQDPGQAGKAQIQDLTAWLSGYVVRSRPVTGDKVTRAAPFSSQCEAGNVSIVRGAWNDDFLTELEGFPEREHDDQVDAASDAFDELVGSSGNAPMAWSPSSEEDTPPKAKKRRRRRNTVQLEDA